MSYSNFMNIYEKLNAINEATLSENIAGEIDLAKCRVITSDVTDIRGELEKSSCLEYNGKLTRVQVRTVIIRETENGKEFLAKRFRYRMALPGGGYDQEKDKGDILKSAKREALEEFNFTLSNVEDTGIRTWRSRDDNWVVQHIKNPEDRWTGYYSFYIVGKVSGLGNNENPEEINKWKWYPIKDLEKVNKDVYNYVCNLDEAIRPDKEGRSELGEISYLCGSLETLRIILKNMTIQKTYVKEVRYEKGEYKGNTQRIKQYSVSTSTDLTGHAKRRPNKWGFGVILDGAELSRYYDIEPYNHADHKLLDLPITKLVKLKEGTLSEGRVILMLGEYGNRIISSKDDADLQVYNLIIDFLKNHPEYLEKARTKEHYISKKDPTKWTRKPFGNEGSKCDSRFTNLSVDQIEELYVWPFPFSKNAVPVKSLDEKTLNKLASLLGTYSSFEENEERIWVENELINYLQIPPSALKGIILPEFFKEEFYSGTLGHSHLAWLKDFVEKNNLRVDWHDYVDKTFYKSQLDASNSSGTRYRTTGNSRWADWDEVDNERSSPESILKQRWSLVKMKKVDNVKDDNVIKAVIADAAVRLAIKEVMTDLTYENFDKKYEEALGSARLYYRLAGYEFRAKSKADRLFTELFDYWCPEKPEPTNSIEQQSQEKTSMYDLFLGITVSKNRIKDFVRSIKREFPNRLLNVAYTLWFINHSREKINNSTLPVEVNYNTFLKVCARKYNLTEEDLVNLK